MGAVAQSLCVLLVVLTNLLAGAGATWAALPSERGPYGVRQFRDRVADATESRRATDLLVFCPAVSAGMAPPVTGFPLVVFSPGFLLSGNAYRSYGEHLASHGLVVALPTLSGWLGNAGHPGLVADMCAVTDYCLAEDEREGSALFGLIDESAIGATGHSFGGKLCLMQALADSRVRAVASIDPVDGGGMLRDSADKFPSLAPEEMGDLHVPLLIIGSERVSVPGFLVPCVLERQNYAHFFDAANPPAIEITQRGAGHGQYIDPGLGPLSMLCAPGTVSGEWVRASAAAYLAAFFLGTLRGDSDARTWWDEQLANESNENLIVVREKEAPSAAGLSIADVPACVSPQ